MRVTKLIRSRKILESSVKEGDSPVCKMNQSLVEHLSTTGHANPVGI